MSVHCDFSSIFMLNHGSAYNWKKDSSETTPKFQLSANCCLCQSRRVPQCPTDRAHWQIPNPFSSLTSNNENYAFGFTLNFLYQSVVVRLQSSFASHWFVCIFDVFQEPWQSWSPFPQQRSRVRPTSKLSAREKSQVTALTSVWFSSIHLTNCQLFELTWLEIWSSFWLIGGPMNSSSNENWQNLSIKTIDQRLLYYYQTKKWYPTFKLYWEKVVTKGLWICHLLGKQ